MAIEIREVVIKAQLERSLSQKEDNQHFSAEKIQEIKKEILSELLEKMEEKLWKKFER